MTNPEIFELMARFDKSAVTGLKLTQGGFSIELTKGAPRAGATAPLPQAAPVQEAAPGPEPEDGGCITAPLVGTYYGAPGPDAAPFVAVGDRVKKGQTVCLLEAMKMMSEVPAPCDCVVEALLQESGTLVSYGEPLIRYREV